MGAFDFNTAPEQRDFDVIPDGTIVVVQLNIRAGNAGEDGLFKRSKNGDAEGLDCELTVVEGPYAKRKVFVWMLLSGTTDGQAQMAHSNKGKLRAILESARGIKPQDVSEVAKKARIAELRDFDGIRFMAELGIERGKDGYRDKNILKRVITSDHKEWHPIEQPDRSQLDARKVPEKEAAPSNVISKPAWAK
jgi:hypothetical protein